MKPIATLFSEMSLPETVNQALENLKFSTPTPIQQQAIPIAMNGDDMIGCAQTGTGKTAAFCVPLMAMLLEHPKKNGLILVPTRELAFQVIDFWKQLTAKTPQLRGTLLIGGADMRRQIRSLNDKPRVIVATPGRLMDHLARKSVSLAHTAMLVLDEADRMLDMGFTPQLNKIVNYLSSERQTLLFSATLPSNILKLAARYLRNPKEVMATAAFQPVSKIKHSVLHCRGNDKGTMLLEELNRRQGTTLIFARTKDRTDRVANMLYDEGFSVTLIHGDRSQGQRNNAIRGFREGKFRILVATDIAARGLDIPHIAHVINFDLPQAPEDYVHRIGRTARAGAEGEALCLITNEDHAQWRRIARLCKLEADLPKNSRDQNNSSSFADRGPRRSPRPGSPRGGNRPKGGESSGNSNSSRQKPSFGRQHSRPQNGRDGGRGEARSYR